LKKFLVTSLVFCLTLLMAGGALAAVHNFSGDFVSILNTGYSDLSFDEWYYIEKDDPSATVRGSFSDFVTRFGLEYFQNDQTFLNLTFADYDHDYPLFGINSFTALKGSFLLENNFFVGLEYGDFDNLDITETVVSPGYRYNLDGDAGYIAVSMDYAVSDEGFLDSGMIDLEVSGRYYTDQSRVYGQLFLPNDDVIGTDEMLLMVGGAYRYNDNVVFGANYITQDDYSYIEFGATTNFDKLGAELRITDDDDTNEVDCNVLYSFADNIRAGLLVAKVEKVDDPYLVLKGKYTVDDKNAVILMHQLKNDSSDADAVTYLRWDVSF
jgi:hypothetical protein